MERKIGEIFELGGEWYQCVESDSCGECSVFPPECGSKVFGLCSKVRRTDNKHVIFKKLEKVGEPFTSVGKLYQHYKVFEIDNVCGDGFWCVHNYKAKTLTIEIKQTKEDMEEKKLNLKPFDLEAARSGKPVCTRDCRKARIICFDAKGDYPIVALIESGNIEGVQQYMIDGHCTKAMSECYGDLMMLPEKRIGWININKDAGLFTSKEEAERDCTKDYATVRVEFEI